MLIRLASGRAIKLLQCNIKTLTFFVQCIISELLFQCPVVIRGCLSACKAKVGFNQMINGFDELQKANKDSMDMASKSFGAFSKGLQAIATEYADFSKKSVEDWTAAFEKMVAAKSPDKAFEVQSDYMKSAYENMVGEFNKLSEMYLDLGKEAYKPFEGMIGKAASK